MSLEELKELVALAKIKEQDAHMETLKAEQNYNDARAALSGIVLGQIVMYKGIEHKVVEIDASWHDMKLPWLKGNARKKDGTFGIKVVHMYSDWKVIEKNS